MKKSKYLFILSVLLFFACKNSTDSLNDFVKTEQLTNDETVDECYLEDFTHLINAKQFKDLLETQEITNDTMWMNEGADKCFISKTTGCPSITAYWKNKDFSDLIKIDAVDHVMNAKDSEDYIYCNSLKSKTGIEMRMSLKKLIKLNGDDITFKGFGNKNGGMITSFGDGMLKGENLIVYLDYENAREGNFNYPKISQSDTDFSTNNSELDTKDLVVVKMEKVYTPLK